MVLFLCSRIENIHAVCRWVLWRQLHQGCFLIWHDQVVCVLEKGNISCLNIFICSDNVHTVDHQLCPNEFAYHCVYEICRAQRFLVNFEFIIAWTLSIHGSVVLAFQCMWFACVTGTQMNILEYAESFFTLCIISQPCIGNPQWWQATTGNPQEYQATQEGMSFPPQASVS